MKYQHVQKRGSAGFIWRLSLCGETLRNLDRFGKEKIYNTPASAAFDCDLVKYFLREKFNLVTSKTEASLTQPDFYGRAEEAGIEIANLDAVFDALPEMVRDAILNVGCLLAAHRDRQAVLAATPPPSEYLETLLASVSARLIEATKVIEKAKQLKSLTDLQRAALCTLSAKFEAQEILYREEVASILGNVFMGAPYVNPHA